jgi:hypothetical protein
LPLPWFQVVGQAKVFGATYTSVFTSTVAASWDQIIAWVEHVLQMWPACHLPTLRQRSAAIETFALLKACYLAQILPLPLLYFPPLGQRLFWPSRPVTTWQVGVGLPSILPTGLAFACAAIFQGSDLASMWRSFPLSTKTLCPVVGGFLSSWCWPPLPWLTSLPSSSVPSSPLLPPLPRLRPTCLTSLAEPLGPSCWLFPPWPPVGHHVLFTPQYPPHPSLPPSPPSCPIP